MEAADEKDTEPKPGIVEFDTAMLLLKVCEQIQSALGVRLNRYFNRHTVESSGLGSSYSIQSRLMAFEYILTSFCSVLSQDALDDIISVQNNSAENARDAVISWLRLLAPLIALSHENETQRLSPKDVICSFLSLKPETVTDAFWAPDRAVSRDVTREVASDRLLALMYEKSLVAKGYPVDRVRSWLFDAYGVSWEAMRKWKDSVINVLGREIVDSSLELFSDRSSGLIHTGSEEMNKIVINLAGAAYRRRVSWSKVNNLIDADGISDWLKQKTGDDPELTESRADGSFPQPIPSEQHSQANERFEQLSMEIVTAASLVLKALPS